MCRESSEIAKVNFGRSETLLGLLLENNMNEMNSHFLKNIDEFEPRFQYKK